MPRLFVGIPLPASYGSHMMSLTSKLGSGLRSTVRWTRPENLHLTLRFLGHVERGRLPQLRAALQTVDLPSFYVRAGGCGLFPEQGSPRVIWAGIAKGAHTCAELAERVGHSLIPLGFEAEKRAFKCHLTLGRIKRVANDDWVTCLRRAAGLWPGFKADRFVLWESQLTQAGPVYSLVEEFLLGEKGG